jgi:outer membrane protein OmpA-like peptidoglycan-associated protein
MANSFLSSIIGTLDSQTVDKIAASLGAPGQSVSQGLRSSVAAVLASIASKSEDSHALRGMLDLNPNTLADTTLADVTRAATDPNSSLIAGGKRVLSGLFGKLEAGVTEAVGTASGLRYATSSTLLAMVAPWVLSFINQRVRAEGLSMTGLGNLLEHEAGAIRSALPPGLTSLFWRTPEIQVASPIAAQAVKRESSSLRWLVPLLVLAALIPAIAWLVNSLKMSPAQSSRVTLPAPNLGSANRVASEASRLATNSIDMIKGTLNEDLLRFETGSAALLPDSEAKLDQIASTLKDYPDVHATVNGYTDNVGSAGKNLELSRRRADIVMIALVRRGVSSDHLTAEGHGPDDPIADNSTTTGRAQNRRVAVDVSRP